MLSPLGSHALHPLNSAAGSQCIPSTEGSTSPGQIDSSVFIPAHSPTHPTHLNPPTSPAPHVVAQIPSQYAATPHYTSSTHTGMSHPQPILHSTSTQKEPTAGGTTNPSSHPSSPQMHVRHALQYGTPSSAPSSTSGNRDHPNHHAVMIESSGVGVAATALHHGADYAAAASTPGMRGTVAGSHASSMASGAHAVGSAAGSAHAAAAPSSAGGAATQPEGVSASDTLGPRGGGTALAMGTPMLQAGMQEGGESGAHASTGGAAALPPMVATETTQVFHQEHTEITTLDASSAPAPELAASRYARICLRCCGFVVLLVLCWRVFV